MNEGFAFCGVDTHKDTHTAMVLDCWLNELGCVTFENRPGKFEKFVRDVKKISKDLNPVFGLEDTRGFGRNLAQYLQSKKFIVKSVNPSYTNAIRLSAPTNYKTDTYDAYCLARILRDMYDRLPDGSHEDIFWTIRQLVKRRDFLAKSAMKLHLQLHAQLTNHYPSYRKFFTLTSCPTALYFWENYPSPKYLEGISSAELAAKLRKIGGNSCSTRKAENILNLIEADRDTEKEYQDERDFIVQSIVRESRYKQQEIKALDEQVAKILPQTGYKLESMPGISINTASHIVSEIGDISRFSSADKLARFAGVAPTIFSSAGKGKEKRSKQGNRSLNAVLYFLAVQLVSTRGGKPTHPFFHEYFLRKVSEGKKKTQAIICIQRRLINIIYGLMKNKTAYRVEKD